MLCTCCRTSIITLRQGHVMINNVMTMLWGEYVHVKIRVTSFRNALSHWHQIRQTPFKWHNRSMQRIIYPLLWIQPWSEIHNSFNVRRITSCILSIYDSSPVISFLASVLLIFSRRFSFFLSKMVDQSRSTIRVKQAEVAGLHPRVIRQFSPCLPSRS